MNDKKAMVCFVIDYQHKISTRVLNPLGGADFRGSVMVCLVTELHSPLIDQQICIFLAVSFCAGAPCRCCADVGLTDPGCARCHAR